MTKHAPEIVPSEAAGTSTPSTPAGLTDKPTSHGGTKGGPADRSEPRIARPGAIVHPRMLTQTLVDAANQHVSDPIRQRAAMLDTLRTALKRGRDEIQRRFEQEPGGGDTCVTEQVYLMDRILRAIAETIDRVLYPAPNPTVGERFAVVAIGGYGRGELAPFSDLDILFVVPYRRAPRVEQAVEGMLYLLWDLGLTIGHAVRTIDECVRAARKDTTIRTSLIEQRFLFGDRRLFEKLRRKLDAERTPGAIKAFIAAKLGERDERHVRWGASRYMLEPNIKEGKGGQRDLHTLMWIARFATGAPTLDALVRDDIMSAAEARRFRKARSHLRDLRCHLHYLTGRAEERLTFDRQPDIACLLGYTDRSGTRGVERMMKHYFLVARDVGFLTAVVCASLELDRTPGPMARLLTPLSRRAMDGFTIENGRIIQERPDQFAKAPIDLIRVFQVADRQKVDLHPDLLRTLTRSLKYITPSFRADPAANRLFLDILTGEHGNPEPILRRMAEAGVLGRFVPDFGRVTAQMQFDMYHVYTVDEHTLRAMGILHDLLHGPMGEDPPLIRRVAQKINSWRPVYVAMFCHDIAKGRGGDHSILGERVARAIGRRLGLDDEETDTAAWLVRHHLLMSDIALRRDIDDDATIEQFAGAVASVERLRLLILLTAADIQAVGPGRWTGWKATLISQLYLRTRRRLTAGFEPDRTGTRISHAKQATREVLEDFTDAEFDAFADMGYDHYWLALEPETHALHARLMRQMVSEAAPLVVDAAVRADHQVTEVTVIGQDHPGLFMRLTGALAVAGATILDAKIFTHADGTAIDVFTVADASTGGAFDETERRQSLEDTVRQFLLADRLIDDELTTRPNRRSKAFRIQPRVLIDNNASAHHTVIEVTAQDRPGVLYDMARALRASGCAVASAKITTYGTRVVDVFYVKDVFGLKVESGGPGAPKHARIRTTILDTLSEGERRREA